MRLIDADALVAKMNLAIAMLKRTMKNFDIEDDPECQMELKAYRDIRDGIKDEPTIEPQRWIPCSERLPQEEDYKSCIECLDGAVWYFTENGTMGIGYYYQSTKEWSTTDDLKTDGKVIAWMPLPIPYIV